MGVGGRAWAAAVALVAAAVPGAVQLLPTHHTVERATVIDLDLVDVAARPSVPSVAHGAGPDDEVPIIPPGDLGGELAEAVPVPPPFEEARSGAGDGEVFALVIGIDDYPGTSSDLRSAVADADLVDAALAGFGVPAANRVVLRDGQARRPEVEGAIRSLVTQGGPTSTLVLAFAGHTRKLAPGREAIVLADGTTLTDLELAALLEPAVAQQMWLLFATCYAGGFTELLAPGRILTGAADAHSLAYESPALNASYLVHHLVRAGWLQGEAGPTVQEAYRFADSRIESEHPRRRPVQLDQHGRPMRLGPGDPGVGYVPPSPPAPAPSGPGRQPPPPSSPSTTAPSRPKQSCLLGVVCTG